MMYYKYINQTFDFNIWYFDLNNWIIEQLRIPPNYQIKDGKTKFKTQSQASTPVTRAARPGEPALPCQAQGQRWRLQERLGKPRRRSPIPLHPMSLCPGHHHPQTVNSVAEDSVDLARGQTNPINIRGSSGRVESENREAARRKIFIDREMADRRGRGWSFL